MKKLLALLLMLVLVVSLAACGGGSNKTDGDKKDSSADEKKEETKDKEVKKDTEVTEVEKKDDNPALAKGNIFSVGTSSLDGKFNPIISDAVYDSWITEMVFSGLISNNPAGEVVMESAESYELSEDKLTYTFKLKDGMKFHDGTPVTADDVAFTFTMIGNPKYDGPRGTVVNDMVGIDEYREGKADSIAGIKVIDPLTIAFTIKEPNVQKIWDFGYGIMPKAYYGDKSYEEFLALNDKPIGSGPMKLKEYVVGQYVELERFDDCHRGKTKVDGVVVKIVPTETQIASLKTGEVDAVNPPASQENYDQMMATGVANVQEFTGNGYNYIGINQRLEKFKDKRVRQALYYGLNLDQFIDAQWEGFAQRCLTPISPVSWAYPGTDALTQYEYNPEKAKELLKEAGWEDTDGDGFVDKNGEKFTITWTAYNDVDWPQNLVAVATENWKEIGIELKADLMEFNAVADKVYDNQDFELYNMGWSLSIDPDPSQIFSAAAAEMGGYNSVGFINEEAEKLFKEGLANYDQEKRAEVYKKWGILANEELPYLFVAIRNEIWGVNTRVSNLNLGPYYRWTYSIMDVEVEHN